VTNTRGNTKHVYNFETNNFEVKDRRSERIRHVEAFSKKCLKPTNKIKFTTTK